MKNRKINLTKLFKIGILFFGISLLLWNCEKEEYIETISKKSIAKKVSLNEMFEKDGFKQSYTKIKEKVEKNIKTKQIKKGVSQKNTEEDLYDFKIDTTNIMLTELDTITSYAMSISRNYTNKDYFENLVLQKKSGENVGAYLLRYVFSSNDNVQKNNIKVIELELDKINFSNRMLFEEVCSDVFLTLCTGGTSRDCNGSPHIPGPQCINEYYHCIGSTYVGRTCTSGSGDVGDFSTSNNHSSTTNTGTGGGSTGVTVPIVFNTNPIKFYEMISSFEDAIFYAPSRFESVESQFSYLGAVGKFLKQTSFYELGDVLFDLSVNQTTLNENEAALMTSKTVEILTLIKNVNSFDQLSLSNQKIVATNSLFLSFLPNVSSIIGEYWPKNAEEWAVINDLIKQFLPELILGFVPGSSALDVVSGINKGDATTVTLGIAGILVDTFGGSIFKGIAKAGRVSYKVFKSFKIIYKFFRAVSYAIKTGLKTKLVDDIVYLTNSASKNVAKITDDVVEIITDAGLKLINPSALKKLEKLTPTSSGYINSTKLGKAKRFKPSESGLKADFDNLKSLDNNQLGLQSETLANKLFKQDDYLAYDAKIPGFNGNNGFDGVYIKKDAGGNVTDIIINEVKQVNNGSIALSSANTATGLPRQMTNDWIDNVIGRMLQPNTSQSVKNLANLIKTNDDKITKVVTGIDKTKGEILVFPIN